MATKQKKPMAKTIIKAAVIIGVLIIPLMYSYFYLSAFWDPYSRLQDVSVAVVNLDQGAKINGKDRNVGKEICDNLEEDGSLDFHFVSEVLRRGSDSGRLDRFHLHGLQEYQEATRPNPICCQPKAQLPSLPDFGKRHDAHH